MTNTVSELELLEADSLSSKDERLLLENEQIWLCYIFII